MVGMLAERYHYPRSFLVDSRLDLHWCHFVDLSTGFSKFVSLASKTSLSTAPYLDSHGCSAGPGLEELGGP